jgi:hypothetical protein
MRARFASNIKSERIDDDHIKLLESFTFIDSNGLKWTAPADYVSDGASIPVWLQRIVGHPFDGNYIEAAVIHDFYCYKKLRSQKDTHKAFVEALKVDGVSWVRRTLMHQAVKIYNRLMNPKWA